MRGNYLHAAQCKKIAKSRIENKAERKIFKGFATIRADSILSVGAGLEYTPDQFEGHADIRMGVVRVRGEPLDPQENKIYQDRLQALLKRTQYFPDPHPDVDGWAGEKLKAS